MTVGAQQALLAIVTLLLSLVKSQQDLHSEDETTLTYFWATGRACALKFVQS